MTTEDRIRKALRLLHGHTPSFDWKTLEGSKHYQLRKTIWNALTGEQRVVPVRKIRNQLWHVLGVEGNGLEEKNSDFEIKALGVLQ